MEGESAFLFTSVSYASLLSDGRIAIADAGSSEIRVFNRDGGVSWIAGGSGEGPGEFQRIGWMRQLPDGEIAAYDFVAFRLSVFGTDGVHLRTEALDFSVMGGPHPVQGLFDNGTFLLRDLEGRRWTAATIPDFGIYRTPVAHVFLNDGRADTIHVSEGRETYIISEGTSVVFGDTPLGPREVTAMADSFAVVGLSTEPVLMLLRERGGVDTVGIPLPERPYSPERQDEFRGDFLGEMDEEDVERGERVLADVPAPGNLPYFDAVEVDSGGRIWVRQWAFGEPLRDWLVIDQGGEAVARIAIPDSVQVLDVGESVVIGRTEDEFDVQRIHLFQILRGP